MSICGEKLCADYSWCSPNVQSAISIAHNVESLASTFFALVAKIITTLAVDLSVENVLSFRMCHLQLIDFTGVMRYHGGMVGASFRGLYFYFSTKVRVCQGVFEKNFFVELFGEIVLPLI